jgi:Tol biopolymer transport system component
VIERTTRGGDKQTVFDYRGEGVVYLSDRSWDGLLTLVGIAERNRRIAQLVPRGGGEAVVVAEGALTLPTARVSPDGKWVAFSSRKSGRLQVYVSPIPASGDPLQVSSAGGDYPQWRGDGHELFTSHQTAR